MNSEYIHIYLSTEDFMKKVLKLPFYEINCSKIVPTWHLPYVDTCIRKKYVPFFVDIWAKYIIYFFTIYIMYIVCLSFKNTINLSFGG